MPNSMGSLDIAALFQSSRQPPHGPWPSLSRSINVAIEAMKYEYCAKNTVQFSTAGKHYPCHYKKALQWGDHREHMCRAPWLEVLFAPPAVAFRRCQESCPKPRQCNQETELWTGHGVGSSLIACKREDWTWHKMEDETHYRKNYFEILEVIIITIMRQLLKSCH